MDELLEKLRKEISDEHLREAASERLAKAKRRTALCFRYVADEVEQGCDAERLSNMVNSALESLEGLVEAREIFQLAVKGALE